MLWLINKHVTSSSTTRKHHLNDQVKTTKELFVLVTNQSFHSLPQMFSHSFLVSSDFKFATVSLSGTREGAKESSRHNFRLCLELRTSPGQSGYNVLIEDRREQACRKFVASITPESVLFTLIKSKIIPNTAPYSLRSGVQFRVATGRIDRFNNFVTVKYV